MPVSYSWLLVIPETNTKSTDLLDITQTDSVNNDLFCLFIISYNFDFHPAVSVALVKRAPAYFIWMLEHENLAFWIF